MWHWKLMMKLPFLPGKSLQIKKSNIKNNKAHDISLPTIFVSNGTFFGQNGGGSMEIVEDSSNLFLSFLLALARLF